MQGTHHIVGVVEGEHIRLPEGVRLPDGLRVRVVWRDDDTGGPYDREPLTSEDVEADIAWAHGTAQS